jgi:hypothetical protein
MDLKRIIPLLCLVGVFVWGGLKLKKGFTKVMSTNALSVEDAVGTLPPNLNPAGLGRYLRLPKDVTAELAASQISKECEPFIKGVEGLDLINFKDPIFKVTFDRLVQASPACVMTDEGVTPFEKEYLAKCFLSNPAQADLLSEPCVYSIYALRGAMTRLLEKNKKLSEMDSPGKLTDLLYAEVSLSTLPDAGPLNLARVGALADRLVELNPNLLPARRVQFFVLAQKTIQEAPKKTLKEQDELWGKLSKAFEENRAADHLDEGEPALSTLIQTRGFNPALTLQYADEQLAKNPNDAWAVMLTAYGHWKNGETEEAFKEVSKAVELDPKNEDFRKVMAGLTAVGAGEEAFLPALKFTLIAQDFDK